MTGRPRPAVVALPAYRPGRSAAAAEADYGIADAIKLASNELPYGPLPSVAAAIRDAADGVAVYPDHRATELRAAIAARLGVTPDRVTVGAGSVGLLQQLALTYVDKGDGVAFCWPSFEAYPVFAGLVDAAQSCPPLRRQTFDLEALVAAVDERTKVVFIANPNNPTGTVLGTDDLISLIERVPTSCLVVVDEAYAEFVTDPRITDSVALLDRFPNVVLLRTFSKAHGLAALRIGYAVGHADVIDVVDRTLVPFVVNGIGQRAALASLRAEDEMRERVAQVVAGRSSVVAALRRAGWGVPEPQANFVWLPAGRASAELGVALERLGVVTRVFPDVGIRVTIGDESGNERFLEAFAKVAVELDPDAWQLPTGDLSVRVAGALDALDAALARLAAHANAARPGGLTAPDSPSGEQWDGGQVWAHLAEFGSYWRRELRTIVDSDGERPVPFGRTKRDPHRIGMIEAHRDAPTSAHFATVRRDIAGFRADLAELTPSDWARRGVHETLGEMDLWTFLDHFVTGHYVEHADQLDSIQPDTMQKDPPVADADHPPIDANGTWVDVPAGSPFPLHNLPIGVGLRRDGSAGAFVAIGDHALDLAGVAATGLLEGTSANHGLLDAAQSLNGFAAHGRPAHTLLRRRLIELLTHDSYAVRLSPSLVPIDDLTMLVPMAVGDYVDFYSSLHHATNLGRLFRPDGDPLLPNWRQLPVGYHGRSGTIVADHSDVTRPNGLRLIDGAPVFGPSKALDIELEVGFVVGTGSELGVPISTADAERHLLGLCLVNDWSARDIQAYEYQPLGPFLGKSFATSMSPWIVMLDALEPFRVDPPAQDPPVAEYLRTTGPTGFDLHLEVLVQSKLMRDKKMEPIAISTTCFADMYWTAAQQLAHMTVNGASVRPGDLFASGTVSGPTRGSEGSFIEMTWRGERPIDLPDGTTRAFLVDGDRVTLRGWAGSDPTTRIGMGTVTGTIVPSVHSTPHSREAS